MSHPGAELQHLIYNALVANSELSGLTGSNRIYDKVPPNLSPPYVTFGKSTHSDWSTDTEDGMEHEIELRAWSCKGGRKEVFLIQELLVSILTALKGKMDHHHLVNLTHEQSEISPGGKHQVFLGISIFRAITEPSV